MLFDKYNGEIDITTIQADGIKNQEKSYHSLF